jgi:hypothetical protein
MSTADRPTSSVRATKSRRRAGSRGYTFMEAMIALGVITLMAVVVERTIASTQEAERYLSAVRRVTERGQRVNYEVRHLISASRRLFQRDTIGLDYLDACQFTYEQPLANCRLPLIDETNPLGPDEEGDEETGNIVLFVREAEAVQAILDRWTKKNRNIDTYRFVCIFPSNTTRNLVHAQAPANDLVIWRSVQFPSYTQIMAITSSTERNSVVQDMRNRYGFTHAWDPSKPLATAFYALGSSGMSPTPTSAMEIDEDETCSEGGRLVYNDVQLARTDVASYHRRTLLTADDPADWVPEGFEVKYVGVSGSRKVWFRFVIEAHAHAGQVAVHSSTSIVNTRDM